MASARRTDTFGRGSGLLARRHPAGAVHRWRRTPRTHGQLRAPRRRVPARPVAALGDARGPASPAQARRPHRRRHPRRHRTTRRAFHLRRRSQESIMIDRAALLRDLKPQLRLLEDDLRRRSAEVPEFAETLHLEWEDAKQSNRTAATYDTWQDDLVT